MMTLYSGTTDPFSQLCRIVLHEKGMDFQIIDVDLDHKPEDLAVMNPYNQVPVLVERDLVLHESNIINEYIDERFPHPQLMPAYPVMRARARLFLHRFEKELFSHIDTLEGHNQRQLEKARGLVRDSLMQIAPVFAKHKYMLGEEFSMLDVAITPLLWRLDYYGIQLPKLAAQGVPSNALIGGGDPVSLTASHLHSASPVVCFLHVRAIRKALSDPRHLRVVRR